MRGGQVSGARVTPGIEVSSPWLLIAGGFHQRGGMDRANAALAAFLLDQGRAVHLVTHSVDSELAARPNMTVHLTRKPANSFFLGEWLLDRTARAVVANMIAKSPDTKVVVNGGNGAWPGVNWVHSVHHAWQVSDHGAPLWFKAKNRLAKFVGRRREAAALRNARIVIANSERTRSHLIRRLDIKPEKIHIVYLGADPDSKPADLARRRAARAWLGKPLVRRIAAFVGALGYDNNKGFDTLWSAWRRLCAMCEWDVDLVAAGGGRAVEKWRQRVAHAGLAHRITILGFTDRIADLLAASDLLISPVRYEAYGLNVHEALCCGIPAMVSASAGVAERYPAELRDLLLPRPEDIDDLVRRLLGWRHNLDYWRDCLLPFSRHLRSYTWDDMARDIVALAEASIESGDHC